MHQLKDAMENTSYEQQLQILTAILPSAYELSAKKVVIVRVLQRGFTICSATRPVDSFYKAQGIDVSFDYKAGTWQLLCLLNGGYTHFIDALEKHFQAEGINIRMVYGRAYSSSGNYSFDIRDMADTFSQYYPLYLKETSATYLTNHWDGWVENYRFYQLVDYLKKHQSLD